MIQKNVNENEWKKLVESTNGSIFQTYEWVKTIENSLGYEPIFIINENSGMVFFKRKAKLPFLNVCLSEGGPLFSEKSQVLKILEEFKSYCTRWDILYSTITPPPLLNLDDEFKKLNFYSTTHYTYILDCNQPLELIWKNLSKKARWGVKKAERSNVNVEITDLVENWKAFYSIYEETCKRTHITLYPFSFFKSILENLVPKNMAKLFVAKLGEKIIAGALILTYGKCMLFHFSASLQEFLKYEPNDLLQWKIIEYGNKNNFEKYDFGGVDYSQPESKVYWISKFKEKWGGKLVEFKQYSTSSFYTGARDFIRKNRLAKKLYEILKDTSNKLKRTGKNMV
jgi:lipid II:glycine glycyltransferase (peptidoglycan interpeptide bridge formation enzyme)